jgi:hypothetical protein
VASPELTSLPPKGSIPGDDSQHVSKAAKQMSVKEVTKLMLQMKNMYQINGMYLPQLGLNEPDQ